MSDQWIKQIRQKMADYKQPAPEVSWEAIDKAMAASKPHKLIPLGYWLKGIAAVAILLLVAGISLRIMHRPEETPDQLTAAISNNSVIDNEFTAEELQPTIMAQSSAPKSKTTKVKNTPVISEPVVVTDNTEEPVVSDVVADDTPSNSNSDEQSVTPAKQTPSVHFSSDIQIPTRNHNRQHGGRLMAQAYVSNAMSESGRSESFRQLQYLETIKSNGSFQSSFDPTFYDEPAFTNIPIGTDIDPNIPSNPDIPIDPNNPIGHDNPTDQNRPMSYDTIITVNTIQTDRNIRHHLPVRFGLSIRYQLNDRLSLTSGLMYTLLASDITTNVKGIITNHYEQKLHYLGIPLNIGYQLWTDHKLGLYVTAGGTIDKLLNGSEWQFSLNGSAGADYKLSNRFSLYAEPGVGYYIPNNSNLSTIYKDHPWNFNLTLGLRFDLTQ